MNRLEYKLMQIADRNRDGSQTTQANRRAMLSQMTAELKSLGYKVDQLQPSDLKGRHVNALVKKWQNEGKTAGTIKNRMAVVRWWAEKIGKAEIVKENSVYGIENRVYVTNVDKSKTLKDINLSGVSPYIAQSLRLQDAFGLRREESMKFQPVYALEGQAIETAKYIRLKAAWTKGGRARIIPITSDKQRQELKAALALAKDGSLIPPEKTYKAHLATWEKVTNGLEIGQTHGLRHGYAQERYLELMGFPCPAVGGFRELTEAEKAKDGEVRMQISEELGHSRINITSVYLGSWSKK